MEYEKHFYPASKEFHWVINTLTSASKEFSWVINLCLILHKFITSYHAYLRLCARIRLSYSDPTFRSKSVWKEKVKNQNVYHYTCKTNKLSTVLLYNKILLPQNTYSRAVNKNNLLLFKISLNTKWKKLNKTTISQS